MTVVPGPPTATTGDATGLETHAATLRGTVNPNGLDTTYRFQWGRTTSYGRYTPIEQAGDGTADVPVSASLAGLDWATTYHFRLVARNADGFAAGEDVSFRTPDPVLGGRYRMRLRVTGGGAALGQHRGDRVRRTYRFHATCDAGHCTRTRLVRQAKHGKFRSVLHAVRPALYRGRERFSGGWCDDGLRFTSVARIELHIRRAPKRMATRIGGPIRIRVHGCTSEREKARAKGVRPAA